MLYRTIRRQLKRELTKIACARLGLHTVPLTSEMGEPLALIRRHGYETHGIIHVGANTGGEFDIYRRAALESVVYIEPIPDVFSKLRERISSDRRHYAVNALCAERDGDEVDFHIASNDGASSSVLEFGSHRDEYPEIAFHSKLRLRTTTLDRVIFETPEIRPELLDCLVIEVQGAAAKVFAGAKRTLDLCRFAFIEINEAGFYRGDASFEEVISILKEHGFGLKSLDINPHRWGNAFFVKDAAAAAAA